MRWTQSSDQDLTDERRGWPKDQPRSITPTVVKRICRLHQKLVNDPCEFYCGATAIAQAYRQQYPRDAVPALRTIGRILKSEGLSGTRKKGRHVGAAAYLCYPEHTIHTVFGPRVLELDFIGPKYLAGQSAGLYFLGFSFKKAPKLRYYVRVEDMSTTTLISALKQFLTLFGPVDAVKFDNCPATIGSASAQRTISRTVQFLLRRRIVPIFSVPRKPFSQASIEGNNSVFARKFWNARSFASVADVDRQLVWFNRSSIAYTGYVNEVPRRRSGSPFSRRVIFLRQVREGDTGASIDVVNEAVTLPTSYISNFVVAEWDIDREELTVSIEREKALQTIISRSFPINSNSKYRP